MVEEEIVSVVNADIDLTNIINGRIYPLILPQQPIYPAIVYTMISNNHEFSNHLSGEGQMKKYRFQFDCYHASYSGLKNLALKLRKALIAATSFSCLPILEADEPIMINDSDRNNYRSIADFYITYKEI
jgi:hypothetical protein